MLQVTTKLIQSREGSWFVAGQTAEGGPAGDRDGSARRHVLSGKGRMGHWRLSQARAGH